MDPIKENEELGILYLQKKKLSLQVEPGKPRSQGTREGREEKEQGSGGGEKVDFRARNASSS